MAQLNRDPFEQSVYHSEEELQLLLDKALVTACDNGAIDKVIDLLQKGANVNASKHIHAESISGKNYMTPLMCAAMEGYGKILRMLLENDADPDLGDRYRVTPLHCAALNGHKDCVHMLLAARANPNIGTLNYDRVGVHKKPHRGGTTPLHLAAKYNHPDCIQELIKFGNADCNQANVFGLTGLNIASQNGNEESLLTLLKLGKDHGMFSGTTIVTGDSILQECVRHGMVKSMKELLQLGANVNHKNSSGFTPLHFAVVKSSMFSLEMVRTIIEEGKGIDVNLPIGEDFIGERIGPAGEGLRALHLVGFQSASYDHIHPHEYLTAQYRLDRDFITTDPRNPTRNPDCMRLLIQYGANWNISYKGRTILEQEIYTQGDLSVLKYIMRAAIKIDIPAKPRDVSNEIMTTCGVSEKLVWLRELMHNPADLQNLARYKIREILTPKRLNRRRELPIPPRLLDYLLLIS